MGLMKMLTPALMVILCGGAMCGCALITEASDEKGSCETTSDCGCGEVCVDTGDARRCVAQACISNAECQAGCGSLFRCDSPTGTCLECPNGYITSAGECFDCGVGGKSCGNSCCQWTAACIEVAQDRFECCDGNPCGTQCCSRFASCRNGVCIE